MSRRSAFTLIEAILVVSIITMLIALLLPNLGHAKENGRAVKCRVALHSIMHAFQLFADDQKGILPAAYYEGTQMWQKGWAGKEVGAVNSSGSFDGTLLPYIGGKGALPEAYRCPSLPVGPWAGGVGSNGKFDYSSFASLSGAQHQRINNTATWTDPGSGKTYTTVTAVVVEEDPLRHINGCCIETGHGSSDQQSTTHRGGSNFAAIDLSAHFQQFTARGPNCFEWSLVSPKGVVTTLSETGGWGSWNSR